MGPFAYVKDHTHALFYQIRCRIRLVAFVLVSIIAVTFIIAFTLLYFSRFADCVVLPRTPSNLGTYKFSAVSTDSAFCAELGNYIMTVKGGNVIDAWIVTALCGSLFSPSAAGIGGGFLMVYFQPDRNQTFQVDAREIAPRFATRDMFQNATLNERLYTSKAIAIPGVLKAMQRVWRVFGKMRWKELFAPIIELAWNGVPVTDWTAKKLASLPHEIKCWNESWFQIRPGFHEFLNTFKEPTTDKFYTLGQNIKYPKLARLLELVASSDDSMSAVHPGSVNDIIAKDLRELGYGNINAKDLAAYEVKITTAMEIPITVPSNDSKKPDVTYILHAMHPPSSGVLVGFALNILSNFRYNSREVLRTCNRATKFYHRLVECQKFAMARRYSLGDEGTDNSNMLELLERMSNPMYARQSYLKINDEQTFEDHYYADPDFGLAQQKEDHGTTHVSVLGANGAAVSATSTINRMFGSLLMGKGSGILFNNEMDDFSTPGEANSFGLLPNEQNFIKPGKRPMSSMSPVIITDSREHKVKLVLGGTGGSRIPNAVFTTAALVLYLKLNIKEAIDLPRLHHQLFPDWLEYEGQFSESVLNRLEGKGHQLQVAKFKTAVDGIEVEEDTVYANADYRKGGSISGF